MPTRPTKTLMNTDVITRALGRAAKRAEKTARLTGTPFIIWEDGHIVKRRPDPTPWTADPAGESTTPFDK